MEEEYDTEYDTSNDGRKHEILIVDDEYIDYLVVPKTETKTLIHKNRKQRRDEKFRRKK